MSKPKSTRPASKEPKLQPGSAKEREARSRLTELERENRHLRAEKGLITVGDMSKRSRDMLTRAATTLKLLSDTVVALEEASDPTRSIPISANPHQPSRPNSEKDEGASTRWQRSLLDRLHREVTRLCNEYDLRVEGKWQPAPKPDKVRCMKATPEKCEAYGKRIPKHVGPKGAIELVRCPKCDNRLYPA